MTYRQLCLDVVIRLGQCTVAEVASHIASSIPAAKAATAGRRMSRHTTYWARLRGNQRVKDKTSTTDRGVRTIARETLRRLYLQGKLRRLAPGVYAPPLPKIYKVG